MVVDNLIVIYGYLFFIICIYGHRDYTQDKTTRRTNTLFDDADDIQAQLDNEARDKAKFGKLKTVFIFRLPTSFPPVVTAPLRRSRFTNFFSRHKTVTKKKQTPKSTLIKEWTYADQHNWPKHFPNCGGRSQSPVNLPYTALIKSKGCRHLMFLNYDVVPRKLIFANNGKRLVLYGDWESTHRPLIFGGAAHSRRYVFDSFTLHWPSEHRVGGLQYPMESQVLFISAEYKSFQDAVSGSAKDAQAFLGIVNLYKFSNYTQEGLTDLINAGVKPEFNSSISPRPLAFFSPPLHEYACYQGSLTIPPCTESVLWLIRAKALPVTRRDMNIARSMSEKSVIASFHRELQPLNDRNVFYFH